MLQKRLHRLLADELSEATTRNNSAPLDPHAAEVHHRNLTWPLHFYIRMLTIRILTILGF